ncbi:hypothetical protein CC78DRAFT_587230 [Lojkania enalia]|uniref:WSC domain-containing protein n=1 Tax=Lojkania enalia TaxID=147567 RepID=A0A9P4JXE8_9PLEO|nr:hypothetical protein CC78DRAFT_587230 [Didymosphaeria enalia]
MDRRAFNIGIAFLLVLSPTTGSSTHHVYSHIQKRDLTPLTSPAENWSYTGCYTDQVGQRTLTGGGFTSESMTGQQCVSYCAARNFVYAGVEYAGECYCGNTLRTGATLASDEDCNMACNGDDAQPCGGPNRLTLYNTTVPEDPEGPGGAPSGPFVNPGVNGFTSLGCYMYVAYIRTALIYLQRIAWREISPYGPFSSYSLTIAGPNDDVAARTLPFGAATPGGAGSLTVALCTAACLQAGYLYAGVEYSGECYCGTAIENGGAPADSSSCNMLCNGNSTEYCGGPSRLNLYERQEPETTVWTSIGCYTDSVAARTLATRLFPPGQMTTQSCQSACRAQGFVYAGTEYAGECYCGNEFQNGGGPAPDGDAQCNMACAGDDEQICGGPDRLSMYQWGDGVVPTSSATLTTTPPTSTASTATSSTPPSVTALPDGWSYKGCWVDNVFGRIMSTQLPDDPDLTVELCVSRCSAQGYSVAGMQFARQCFCDNVLRNAATSAPESECNMACAGDSSEMCGAGNRDSVYANTTLIVNPVPSVQKTNLTTNWTYAGCLRDDYFPERALPYQIILANNNTANNCISQCSAFGYNAGGMEYSSECWCGDVSDVSAIGATLVSESECDMACTGNATTICGGSGRLSYYKWNGPTLAEWTYATGDDAGLYQFLIGGVVVPLVTHAARNGKVTFLEKSGTGAPNTTGAYELDLAQLDNFTAAWRPMHVKTDIFCSASITLPDKVGRQINVGGWALDSTFGIRFYWPDGSPGTWGTNDWQEDVHAVSLQNGRWYPTSMILPNGSILVVGGEEGSNGAPVPTLEILPPVGPVIFCDWLQRTDPNNLYPFLAVLPSGGVFVQYWNEARILDEVTFETSRVLPNAPGAVNNFLAGRTYPMEGTAVLLPQHAPYTDPLRIMVCGGSTPVQGYALDNCVTIAPEEEDPEWIIERMPSKRVLTCMTALPDGTFIILNGAQQGHAGFGLATQPNHNAVLYDPRKPLHHRFTVLANTTVSRMYHSEAILLDDGRVLVSGSDPQDDRFPEEYRVEVFIPPYLMGDPVQPEVTISESQSDWEYGQSYTFTSSQGVSAVSILGAGGSTHGNSMGQRTIFPAFSCSGNSCTVTAPPTAHICPPGWYQLFALNANGVPSKAKWVRIGGDPAGLGNWPDAEGFSLPGV